jgi:aspartate racemase
MTSIKYLNKKELEGVLGGAGPRASAEFMNSIYNYQSYSDQLYPPVILISDPRLPDRTENILKYNFDFLLKEFIKGLERLEDFGVKKITIVCITLHKLIPYLPHDLKKKIRDLVTLIIEAIEEEEGPFLMLCTNGTRYSKFIENYEKWNQVQKKIVFPTTRDQKKIHKFIYLVKQRNKNIENEFIKFISKLILEYKVVGWIAGCTELHLITSRLYQNKINGVSSPTKLFINNFIDPLFRVIQIIYQEQYKERCNLESTIANTIQIGDEL